MAIKNTDHWRAPCRGSVAQALAMFRAWGSFPAADVADFVNEVYRLCELIGLDASLLIAHAALETGSIDSGRAFLSSAWATTNTYRAAINRYNPSGLGITDGPDFGFRFAGGTEAARGHVVHHAVYEIPAGDPAWNSLEPYKYLDPRFEAVPAANRGTVRTVADLQGKWWTKAGGDADLATRGAHVFPGIVDQGVAEQPKPAPEQVGTFAPPALLAYLDGANPTMPVIREGANVFMRVNWEVIAIQITPRYQRAAKDAPKRGPDMQAGDHATIVYAWIERDGSLWLYSSYGTRFYGADFILATGAPIVIPDPDPEGTTPPIVVPPVIVPPVLPGGPDWMLVADPASLLPDLAWIGSPNFFPNRQGQVGHAIAIAYHITDDLNYESTRSWFMNPNSNASSHIVIRRDGTAHQYVSSKDASWTNGDYQVNGQDGYRRDIAWLVGAVAKAHNINNYTISYEFVADRRNPPTKAQYATAIKLSRHFCHPKVYAIPTNRGHHIRHSDVNEITRPYCPGNDFELEYIIVEGLGGNPTDMTSYR